MTKKKLLQLINGRLDTPIFRFTEVNPHEKLSSCLREFHWEWRYHSALYSSATRCLSLVCSIPYDDAYSLLARQGQTLNSFPQSWENLSIMLRLYGFNRHTTTSMSIREFLRSFVRKPPRCVFVLSDNKTFVPCLSGVTYDIDDYSDFVISDCFSWYSSKTFDDKPKRNTYLVTM